MSTDYKAPHCAVFSTPLLQIIQSCRQYISQSGPIIYLSYLSLFEMGLSLSPVYRWLQGVQKYDAGGFTLFCCQNRC